MPESFPAAAGILAVLIVISFLCSLAESVLRNITPAEIARFMAHHQLTAFILQRFKNNRILPLTTIALLHYPALLFGLIAAYRQTPPISPRIFYLSTAGYSYLLILFGFILPRALGNRYREPLAFILAVPLRFTTVVLMPLALPISTVCRRFETPRKNAPALLNDNIVLLAREALAEGALSRQQAHLISRSIALSGITAADIMVDRSEIRPIADTCSLSEALIEAHLHHHTRFPLTHENDLDQIIGYVNFKDIVGALRINPADPTLYGIRRPIESVPATTPLPELLQLFTRGRQHIVVVKDSAGTTLGLVTLEDLLETLVGDLEDEYDNPPDFVVQLGEHRFCAGGGTSFSELRERISPEFPDWDVSISEWLLGRTDGHCEEKYSAEYNQYLFTVRKITRGNVFDVIIEQMKTGTAGETQS